jgi:glutamyl-Q tRNA(Asp) synthetase
MGFVDRAIGAVTQNIAHDIGDFVVKRRDGLFAYQLAVVVDDALQGVTDVVRGADLLWSTPRQIVLQRALALPTPRYLHFPVVTNADGEKLSKQTGAQALDAADAPALLRHALGFLGQREVEGEEPGAILAQAARQFVTRGPGGASL